MMNNRKGGENARIDCPLCRSSRIWKNGPRKTRMGFAQRFLCRKCGYRFSESSVLSTDFSYSGGRQVCAFLTEAKNLSKVEPPKNGLAGATQHTEARDEETLINYILKLKSNGYAESTVEGYARILKVLANRGSDLSNPAAVKHGIRMQPWSQGRKSLAVHAYSQFIKMCGLTWEPPNYKTPETLPFIPTEKEIDDLIAGCSYKIAAFLRLLKETAMRTGEGFNLKWIDIDAATNTVRVTPEKGSKARVFKLSNTLVSMLNRLRGSRLIFDYKSKASLRRTFEKQRKRMSCKLSNSRIQRISFHTLRHWKATMEYHRTKDILHVMRLLGHKNIKNTLKYTQLVAFRNDDYSCKVAQKPDEITKLIEAGFEYVTEQSGLKFFRKRK